MRIPSTLQLAQRRTFDVHRVAVMPKTAQQCFHHRPAAQKVRPLVIDKIRCNDGGMLAVPLFLQVEKMFDCSGFRFKFPSSSIRRTSSRARRLSNCRVERSASEAYISSNNS